MKKNFFSNYPVLIQALVMMGVAAYPAFAQQANVTLGSGSSSPGGSVSLNLSLATSGGVQPAGLQWTMNYPPADIATVSVVAGASATAAGKTVTCNNNSGSTICVLFGVNQTTLSDGIAATATFGVTAGTIDSLAAIQITGVVVTDANGNVIASSGISGSIAISQPVAPKLTGLTCTPANITAPGSAACSVTLSAAAPGGGLIVALSSANTNISVPAMVAVSAGQKSSTFTATVGSISSNQTSLLTASLTGVSQTFTVSATAPAPAQISSLSCSPASLGSNSSSTCTVSLNKAALVSSLVTLISSSGSLKIPASVTVAVDQSSATFTATTATVASAQNVTVNGSLNGLIQSTSIALTIAVQSGSLACSPSTVTAPGTSNCTVILTAAAPAGGVSVALSTNNASATLPASIVVAAGTSSASFSVSVAAVKTAQTATLTASAGGTAPSFPLNISVPSMSISGAVSPSSMGSGTVLTLSGSASATVTADTSGNYMFSGLKSGTYTIAAARSGYTFAPSSQSVTLTSGSATGMSFTVTQAQSQTISSIATDAGVWRDQSSPSATITSPSFTTRSANELLLAFISSDSVSGSNATVKSVSGAGLSWVLAVRTNSQSGTAEIWRAFSAAPNSNVSVTATLSQKVAASMTVMSFSGVDTTGTNGSGAIGAIASNSAKSGAPTAKLVTTRNNSWVFGAGNDFDNAIARTPGAGQTLIHQYLATVGDTYWVQSQKAPTPASGTSVTINDTAPISGRFNLSVVEILAAPSKSQAVSQLGRIPAGRETSDIGTETVPQMNAEASQTSSLKLVNIATGEAGDVCSPAGLASIVGSGFGAQVAQKVSSFPLPSTLAGVQVKVNGNAAPLLFASDSQINFQCPALSAGTPLDITVEGPDGIVGAPILTQMQGAVPSLFMLNGTTQGVVLIANTNEIAMRPSKQIASRAALPGEFLTIYASGLGEPVEDVATGEGAPLNRQILLKNKVTVVVGDQEIEPSFAGLAPGTAGLYQLNLQIPSHAISGDAVPLYIKDISPNGTSLQSNTVKVALQATPLQ